MRYRVLPLLFLAWFGTSLPVYSKENAENGMSNSVPKINDMRILIDISGSMKDNDPNNLRIPALRLITQLLPDGSKGGVWTFGQYVNMLVPYGDVDSKWKEKAYAASGQIHSKGLFTNIEGVLKKSTWDLKSVDDNTNRSIIFLTDGVVDISKNQDENQKARKRILGDILTRLKNAGVRIHTIALSSEADRAFLKQLSAATYGWYEEADSAEKLERIFLRMFEKSVPVETLPMTNNKVLVDANIHELTMLVFRKKITDKVGIVLPNGEVINYKSKKDKVRWRHEERYDLITIEKPMPGQWGIDAELDPDNRVMVVTDLSVRASRLPNMILHNDVMPYYIELHQNGETITKPAFLDLVNIKVNRIRNGKTEEQLSLKDDGKDIDQSAGDGRFSANVGGELNSGEYEYELVVDGTTFKRNKRYAVKVVKAPVAVTVKEEGGGNPAHYSLTLSPYSELIKPDSLLIDTVVSKEGGGNAAVNIPRTGPSEWRLDMDINDGDYFNVAINVQAERVNGQQVSFDIGSYRLGKGVTNESQAKVEEPQAPEKTETKEEMQSTSGNIHEGKDEPAQETRSERENTAASHEEAKPDMGNEGGKDSKHSEDSGSILDAMPEWAPTALKVVGFNGVLILFGFMVYRKWFRAPKDDDEVDDAKPDDNGGESSVPDIDAVLDQPEEGVDPGDILPEDDVVMVGGDDRG